LPGAKVPTVAGEDLVPSTLGPQKTYENNLVRTDAKMRKITTMLPPSSGANSSSPTKGPSAVDDDTTYAPSGREPVTCRLLTIKELRAEVRDSMHNGLTETFASHTFVGIVDERRRLAAIQSGVKLFLVDYGAVSAEYFYQVGLTDFGNFGAIRFDPPPNLRDLIRIGAEYEKSRVAPGSEQDFEVEDVVEMVAQRLIDRSDMLLEYFTMEISPDGDLLTIPLLIKGYTPSLAKLPRFLLRLGPYVDWSSEKECFQSFLRELAEFYVPEQLPPSGDEEVEKGLDEEVRTRRAVVRRAVEQVLFPAFATRLLATRSLLRGSVLEVANLKGLYRVFERC
jgi:DNA mismatch repair protein MLH1